MLKANNGLAVDYFSARSRSKTPLEANKVIMLKVYEAVGNSSRRAATGPRGGLDEVGVGRCRDPDETMPWQRCIASRASLGIASCNSGWFCNYFFHLLSFFLLQRTQTLDRI